MTTLGASVTWYYPDIKYKRAPRTFHCSDCGRLIEQGRIYMKANHGRYCNSCGHQYLKKEE